MKFIPVGYGNREHCKLIERLMQDDLYRLVDTRISPRSAVPGWHRTSLEQKYSVRYKALGETLGNKNYNVPGAEIEVADLDNGISHLLDLLEICPVLLLCGCGSYEKCHRKVICEAAVEWCSEIEIVQPEQIIAQERALQTLKDERETLYKSLNGMKPTLANYWILPPSDQSVVRYDKGLRR